MQQLDLCAKTEVRPGPAKTWEASIYLLSGGTCLAENFLDGLPTEGHAERGAAHLMEELERQGPRGLGRMLRGRPLVPQARIRWIGL